jgi:hypothetical protein
MIDQSGKQNYKMAPRVNKKDVKEILRLHDLNQYTHKQIGEMVNISEGIVGYWIRQKRGLQGRKETRNVPKTNATPVGKPKTSSSKESKLTPLEKTLSPDIIQLLHSTQTGDEFQTSDKFVKEYYKKVGFEKNIEINEIIKIWDHREEILNFEKEKELEKKFKERLLAIAAAKKKTTIEEPIREEKRHAFVEEGEQLVKINNRLSEMIAITKEILQVQKDTYILFKDKLDGGKKDDRTTGNNKTTTPAF